MPDDQPDTDPPQQPGAPRLAYRNPEDDRPASRTSELVSCAAMTALTWLGAVMGLLYLAFTIDYRGALAPSGTLGISMAFVGWGIMLATMVVLSLRWRHRPERRHLVLGIWIGFGIACLAQGICYVAVN